MVHYHSADTSQTHSAIHQSDHTNDQNYKPERIFHQAQSTIAHKLFGEFDLEDFPVNQAKDGFVWDDGLETRFVEELKKQIQGYIDIAKLTNKERAKEEEFSEKISGNVQDEVKKFTDSFSFSVGDSIPSVTNSTTGDSAGNASGNQDIVAYEEYLHSTNNGEEKTVGSKRKYPIQINEAIKKDFIVEWSIGNKTYWINVDESEDGREVNIVININHPFFKPYTNNEDFKVVLEKFVISFVVAEQQAKSTSNKEGYIPASAIRHRMNEFLSKVSED